MANQVKEKAMSPYARRNALRLGGSMAVAALSGCISRMTSSNTVETTSGRRPGFDTPPPGECEAVDPPRPGSTEGGLEPIAYPAYPKTITAETARSFASDYEHAYRRNEFIQRYEDTGYDELTVNLGALRTDERDNGFVVGINGELLFADVTQPETATGTSRPSGSSEFAAWYLIADRFAIRNGLEGSLPEEESPDLSDANVVACTS